MARQQYNISMRRSRHSMGGGRQYSFQWERLVILALLVALVVSVCMALPAIEYRNKSRTLYIDRMRTECNTAIQYSKYLSRTASSNSNEQLAVIRSSIYSMDVLNQSYAYLEGEGHYLVDQIVFSNIYNVLEGYFNKLTTGMNTTDQLTDLTNRLDEMKNLLNDLN